MPEDLEKQRHDDVQALRLIHSGSVHVDYHSPELMAKLNEIAALINHQGKQIMQTQAEQTQAMKDMKVQLDKAKAEILAKVKKLEDANAAAGNTTPEQDAAMADLKSGVQSLDDLNPDAGGGFVPVGGSPSRP